MRMQSGHQACPRWAAASSIIKLGKTQTLAGKLIDIGSSNLTAITAKIRIAHVVHQDDHNIGALDAKQIAGR